MSSRSDLLAFPLFCVLVVCIVLFATEYKRCENVLGGEWTASGCVGGFEDP